MEDAGRTSKKKAGFGDGGRPKPKGGSLKEDLLKVLDELEEEEDIGFEEEIARQIAVVEYYFGVTIGLHSPLLKRLNQQEHLDYIFQLDAKRLGLMEK